MKKHKFVISKRVRTFTAERKRERERRTEKERERGGEREEMGNRLLKNGEKKMA